MPNNGLILNAAASLIICLDNSTSRNLRLSSANLCTSVRSPTNACRLSNQRRGCSILLLNVIRKKYGLMFVNALLLVYPIRSQNNLASFMQIDPHK